MPTMADGSCGTRVVQTMLFFISVSLLHSFYCGIAEGRDVSAEEFMEMKSTLKSFNKPAVMTIQTEYGDIYDCIDIYKQPAFDHPSLKKHVIQMEPTSYPKGIRKLSTSDVQNYGMKDGGCPNGAIPIRRTQMQDLLRAESLPKFGMKLLDQKNTKYAEMSGAPYEVYYGTQVKINIWNPKIANASDNQFSASQLWLSAGPVDELNRIEVGWMVNPTLNNDLRTRLFVYWTVDNFKTTGCYNLKCPGFIQTNPRIPVDFAFEQVSTYNGKQYDVQIDVFKDPQTGNWFLLRDGLGVGYWPNSIFNHLNDKATSVDWGGEVSQCETCSSPEMGSGHFPSAGYGKAAYMKDIKVLVNTSMILTDAKDCLIGANAKSCFDIKQNPRGRGTLTGSHIVYGGPGGEDCHWM